MDKAKFLELMDFPKSWNDWGMFPDALFDQHLKHYEPGAELSPEHDRFSAFLWWLKQSPSEEQLLKLVALSFLDPDEIMAKDARRYIAKHSKSDSKVLRAISEGEG
jgi:hypothetical protein